LNDDFFSRIADIYITYHDIRIVDMLLMRVISTMGYRKHFIAEGLKKLNMDEYAEIIR